MTYDKITFHTENAELKDILIAELTALGFDGFEEKESSLEAYMTAGAYEVEMVEEIANKYGVSYEVGSIAQQNWNAEWERNFQPVIVEGFCTVRADFHKIPVKTPYEIVITPKMSFGTGHHATTRLVMKEMSLLDFNGKKVFDFGTGTGILAILAEKLGATEVLGIDNDQWSYDNAIENLQRNSTKHTTISLEPIGNLQGTYDTILANINRHILLEHMGQMHQLLNPGGKILMSGLLQEDEPIIRDAAAVAGFVYKKTETLNNWIVLLFER
jgi:ribosomal protein L11 methyltransferase